MAKRTILAGSTDQTVDIFVQDSSSTTGAGLSGLVFNSAGLNCYYRKGATGSATQLTLATQTVGGAHSDGGFVEVQATNMKGVYRLDLSDTMIAATPWVTVYLYGATNMAPVVLEIEVVSYNPFDGTRLGLTALPNAASGASGGLIINGSNSGTVTLAALTVSGATTLTGNVSMAAGLTVTQSSANTAGISITGNGTGAGLLVTGGATGAGFSAVGGSSSGSGIKSVGTAGNSIALELAGQGSASGLSITGGATGSGLKVVGGGTSGAGIAVTTTSGDGFSILPTAGSAIVATGNGTSKHGLIVTGGTAGTSDGLSAVAGTGGVPIRGNITGDVTGNLSGSVGSVTGAVGSVTGAVGSVAGNVGGNVTGSVGSLATQAKADVNAEVDTALADVRLDELLAADSDIDGAQPPTVGSVFHELMTKTTGSFTYDQTTDSLEAIRDRGDSAWVTATGFSTHSAADVWSVATRILTAATNITSTGGTTVPQTGDSFARIGAAGASLTDLGGMSTTMKAQVNAEVVDTLATDTYAELGQGTPAATNSLANMIRYLFKGWRNKKTQTSSQFSLFADDTTTVDQKATVSDDGTTTTIGEIATGP